MSRILIAVPTYENIYPDTFKSIYDLDCGGNEVAFDFFRGYDVANARNQIGKATVDRGFDYVLMVDNDEVLPKDALLNLLEDEESEPFEKGMAVGYCLARPKKSTNLNGRTTVFKFRKGSFLKEDAYTGKELQELRKNGKIKIQVRGSGLGCALIHRSVFERLPFPWFKWVVYRDGSHLSEDLSFCERFKEISTPIFVDTRVSCGHLMRHIEFIDYD